MEAVVGFSVNPEIEWTGVQTFEPGKKTSAEARVCISGSSLDVALALKECDVPTRLLAAVGFDDPLNPVVEQLLRSAGMDYALLPVRERTCLASVEPELERHLSFKSPVTRVDEDTNRLLTTGAGYKIVTGLMPDAQEIALAERLWGDNHCIRVLNPREALAGDKTAFRSIISHVDWLIMNRFEAAAFLECGPDDVREVHLSAFLDLGAKMVIITLDGSGTIAAAQDGWRCVVPPYGSGPKVDEKGAGDCLLGFFVGLIARGEDRETALRLANTAGGLKVCRLGTTNIPTLAEIQQASC